MEDDADTFLRKMRTHRLRLDDGSSIPVTKMRKDSSLLTDYLSEKRLFVPL